VAGNVYIADTGNNAVKEWTAANGNVSTLVSSGLKTPESVAVDGAGNVYISDSGDIAIKKWTAVNSNVTTLVTSRFSEYWGVAVDGTGNLYFSDDEYQTVNELPYAFVEPTAKTEESGAGSDVLPVVLPATVNLRAPFAPTSDQPWLTIIGINNGVVSFAFTATTTNRTAHITLLGQSIPVTQSAPPPKLLTFSNPKMQANGVFQFGISNSNPGVSFEVLSTTNLSLPLTNWTVISVASNIAAGLWQFSDVNATNFQRFYLLSPLAVSAQPVTSYVGNDIVTVSNGAADGDPPLVILGEYNPASPLATSSVTLPAGSVQDVKFYGGNYNFTLYALSYAGVGNNANEQKFQVVASENFSGSATNGIQSLPVSGFAVNAGDLLAFAGIGPYYTSSTPPDATNSDATYEDSSNPGFFIATPPAGQGTIFTVGLQPDPAATYEYIPDVFQNQGRIYGIGVDVLPTSQ
jgi:hypothetical protein